MPQFAWANDPAAVEEVMTFVLGLTGEKIGSKYLAKARYDEVKTALAKGAKVLNRYNCTGCHVLEMPKFTIPEGTKVAEAFTDFKANVRSSYTARSNDYIPELYPRPDLRSQEEARRGEHRGRAGDQARRRASAGHHRGHADRPVRERADGAALEAGDDPRATPSTWATT